jgi:ubiquinone/menaquinone biosynthesis C-methylase UbiE
MTGAALPHVCPWWLGPLLASPARCLVQDASPIVAPFVRAGMTVLEPGPGMGHFTTELVRRVGPNGRVVAVELQPQMLVGLGRRLRRRELLGRVELRQAQPDRLGVADLAGQVDFALAFSLVHELANPASFFAEVASTLTADGRLLVAEPRGHVSESDFAKTVDIAQAAGLEVAGRLKIRWSRAVSLRRAA